MSEVQNQSQTADPVAELTAIQRDLERINTAIDQLKAAGEDLFADEITALETRANAIATKIEKETIELKHGIQDVETKVKTWDQQFRETHGVSVPVAVIVGGYIVWQVVAAIVRVLGAV